jgi:hypothetical protein
VAPESKSGATGYSLDKLIGGMLSKTNSKSSVGGALEAGSSVDALRAAVQAVEVPEEVAATVTSLIKVVQSGELGGRAAPAVVSDRRLRKSMVLLKLVALSSGREAVNRVDCWLLQHVLGVGTSSVYEEHQRLEHHRFEQTEHRAQERHRYVYDLDLPVDGSTVYSTPSTDGALRDVDIDDDFEYYQREPLLRWLSTRMGIDTGAEDSLAHAVLLLDELFERFACVAAERAWCTSRWADQRWVEGCAEVAEELDALETLLLRQLLCYEEGHSQSSACGSGVLAEVTAHPWLLPEEAAVLVASIRQAQQAQRRAVDAALQEVRALRAAIQLDIDWADADIDTDGRQCTLATGGGEVGAATGGRREDEALLRLCAACASVQRLGVDLLGRQLDDVGPVGIQRIQRDGGLLTGSSDAKLGLQAVKRQLEGLAVLSKLGWRSGRGVGAAEVQNVTNRTRYDYAKLLREYHALQVSNRRAKTLSAADVGLSQAALAMAEGNGEGWTMLQEEVFGHEGEHAAAAAAWLLNSTKGNVLSTSVGALREAWVALRDKVCAGDEHRAAALVQTHSALLTQPAGMTLLSWGALCEEVFQGDADQALTIVNSSPEVITAPRTMIRGAWTVLHRKIFDEVDQARAVVRRNSGVLRTTESKLMGNWRVLLQLTCNGDEQRARALVLEDPKAIMHTIVRNTQGGRAGPLS